MAFQSLAFKSACLLGLVLTGSVPEEANAGSNARVSALTLSTTAAETTDGVLTALDQEPRSIATSPAMVELLIEAPGYSQLIPIYFPKDSADLTNEAHLVLIELALSAETLEMPDLYLQAAETGDGLSEARLDAVATALAGAGLSLVRAFVAPQDDLIVIDSL